MPASQTFLPVFSHVLACTCCLPLPSSHPSSVSHSMTRHIRRVSAPANPHVHLTLAPRPGPWGPPFPPPGEPGVRGIQQGMSGHRSRARAVDGQHHCHSNGASGRVSGLGHRAADATRRGQQSAYPRPLTPFSMSCIVDQMGLFSHKA